MTTLDQRLMASLKIFDRLRPSLDAQAPQVAWRRPKAIPPPVEPPQPEPQPSDPPAGAPTWPPTLETLVTDCSPLPEGAVILGVCDDSLPFLLHMDNPAPGALLVIGDPGAGKTRLLRSMLQSVTYLNDPEQAQFSVIASDPGEWMELAGAAHCQEIFGIASDPCGKLIQELAALAEIRQQSRYNGPAVVLVIDNLTDLLETLDSEAYHRLYWLARHGPRSRIWTVASLPAGQAAAIDSRFLSAFRTRLIGSITRRGLAASLSGDARLEHMAPMGPGEFLLPYGEEWLALWVADPQTTIEEREP